LAGATPEPVVIQMGSSQHQLRTATGFPAVTSQAFARFMQEARVIVTHGGDTVLEAIELGVPVVLVPRRQAYHEHIDDHQVELADALATRGLVTWSEPEGLDDAIKRAKPTDARPNPAQLVNSIRSALRA
jgi:UDP-N-acetylglucosamine transferase subunit ALG13